MATLTLENFITLGMLLLLQLVLGFDNLLYISLESRNAPPERQKFVRRLGIGLAIALRIILLFLLVKLIDYFQDPLLCIGWTGYIEGKINLHSLIVLLGGAFIVYTAVKEIWHLIDWDSQEESHIAKKRSINGIIFMIVVMNLVFSFDSILSAMALTNVFWVMALAIIIGGVLMIWLADKVSRFLERNRAYEILGLFILFLVGIMLLTEGGHLAHLYFWGNEITPMSKTTFYFVIVVLFLVDLLQSRYQKKLLKKTAAKKNRKQKKTDE